MPRNVKFDGKFYRDTNMEMRTLKLSYDFAVDGGDVGAITLKDAFGDAFGPRLYGHRPLPVRPVDGHIDLGI